MMSLSSLLVTHEVVSPSIQFNRLLLTSTDIDKQTQYDTKTSNINGERFAMAGFNLEEKKKELSCCDVFEFKVLLRTKKQFFFCFGFQNYVN